MMSIKQKTIKNEVSLSGVGLHTGNTVKMTFKPAPVNHGYAFTRVDLEGEPIIAAKAEYVVNTQRGTNLEKNGVQIQTSEHVLAAAVGLGIDNLLIDRVITCQQFLKSLPHFEFIKMIKPLAVALNK